MIIKLKQALAITYFKHLVSVMGISEVQRVKCLVEIHTPCGFTGNGHWLLWAVLSMATYYTLFPNDGNSNCHSRSEKGTLKSDQNLCKMPYFSVTSASSHQMQIVNYISSVSGLAVVSWLQTPAVFCFGVLGLGHVPFTVCPLNRVHQTESERLKIKEGTHPHFHFLLLSASHQPYS